MGWRRNPGNGHILRSVLIFPLHRRLRYSKTAVIMYATFISLAGHAFHASIDVAGTLYDVPGTYADDRSAMEAAAKLAAFLLRKSVN